MVWITRIYYACSVTFPHYSFDRACSFGKQHESFHTTVDDIHLMIVLTEFQTVQFIGEGNDSKIEAGELHFISDL